MTAYISDCGYCHETRFTQWYSKSAPRDRHGRVDLDYLDSQPVAYCSEEHRDAADALRESAEAAGKGSPAQPNEAGLLDADRIEEIRDCQLGDWYSGPWASEYADKDGDDPGYYRVVHLESGTTLATLPDWAGPIALWMADAHEAVPELLAIHAPAAAETADTTPLVVRWDRTVTSSDGPDDDTIVCCLAEDGRPVALLLDDEHREAIGLQLLDPDGDDEPDELTIYRASHDSIVMGLYITAAAAREHCEADMRRDLPSVSLDWIEDEEDGVAELVAAVGEEERPTGFVVTPLTVASAYDEEADE
ncbi:hypothetical protein [Streptomyces sp. MK37H]|uniref:hypothetical protein n=1 Tax=Streptomyces sp. MK37H TaxID=2699117 RepID=UPI001B360444|nr:hypothetical protein [Streptomyces sp. MK37H]MBP8536122.1 hypothetical protein [Streptomyces sp. MK37H]